MMELRICAFVVTLSVVTATPYGYGVKGGAGASSAALSSASAGAFGGRGDIPTGQLTFGPGFSGSFSKSSSSSSASSSASSSSSSSSFSYNGAGAVPGYGNVGCTSCQSSGANDGSANHEGSGAGHDGTTGTGAGHHGISGTGAGHHETSGTGAGHHGTSSTGAGHYEHNGANAGAGTGLDAPSGAGCQGPTCQLTAQTVNSPSCWDGKCTSGQLRSTPQTGVSPSCWNGKCTSGQHRSTPQTGTSSTPYDDSDDIPFVAHTAKSTQDARDQSTNHDTTSQYNAGSHCAGGNCGSSTTYNGYPSGATPSYHEPSKHLETPKEGPGCQSGSCRPSSYNVPIHGNYDAKPQCANGICENPQKGSFSPTTGDTLSTNYLSPHDIQSTKSPSYSYSDSPACVGSSCGPVPSGQTGGRPSSTLTPSSCTSPNCKPHYSESAATAPNVQPGQNSQTGPKHASFPTGPTYGISPSGCTTPNCFNQASLPGTTPKSSYSGKPSGDASGHKQPTYTGGFGGPAGMLTPNVYNAPTSVTSKPVYSASPSYITPSDTSSTSCKTPGCLGSYPSAGATASSIAQSGSYGADKHTDSVTISGDKLPSYTGGFGGPAGMLNPDNYDIQVTNKPVYSSSPSYNSHPYTAPLGTVTSPSTSVDSSSEQPAYTGGFGGPAGFLKPNEYDVPHTTSNGQNPSYASVSPSKAPGSNNLAGCSTPNCHSSSDISKHPSHPTHDVSIISPISPGFTTNYIGPVGVTYPSASPVAPISASDADRLPHHLTGSYSAGCRAGNCDRYYSTVLPSGNAPSGSFDHTHPSTPVKPSSPQYTEGYGVPSSKTPNYHSQTTPNYDTSSTNCKNGNCPTGNVATDAHPASSSGSKHELPSYTSGFGGPSGLLNPGDYSNPAAGLSPTHEKPSTGASAPGVAGTCTSGSCSPKETSSSLPGYNSASGAGAHASASASANAVAYSGGFGGPPGLLAPYDDGKVAGGHHQGSDNGGANHNAHEKPGAHGANTGALAGSAAGSTAYSGAVASSGSYGYNAHGAHQPGSNTKGGSPCGGGCSGGYQDGLNGNSAAGSTGHSNSGAHGFGGSFASSSASAHASSGAYTKGGYGKR